MIAKHLDLEGKLRNAVEMGHAVIAITGPTKCGKTVLRRKVIASNASLTVEGGQVSNESDVWGTIREHLEEPVQTSRTSSDTKGSTRLIKASIGLSGTNAGTNTGTSGQNSSGNSSTYQGMRPAKLLQAMMERNDVLIVDDFHYINKEVRAKIVRSSKSAVFDGLTVVILSVPYRAFDVVSAETEMEGRFTHLPIPSWNVDDLEKIAYQGFPALGMNVAVAIIVALAHESMGSPLLMQSLCAEYCLRADVLETLETHKTYDLSEINIQNVFERVARDFGLPAFEKLSAGPQSRTDRNPRPFTNGSTGDIYEALIAAIAFADAPEKLPYDDLRTALKDTLTDAIPQKGEITRAIGHMVEIAKKIQNETTTLNDNEQTTENDRIDVPSVDWKDDTLYINDVFLRFYLKWIHKAEVIAISSN